MIPNNFSTLNIDELLWILDNTFGNIFVTDKNAQILFINKNAAEVFGLDRDEVIGLNTQDLIDRGVIDKSTTITALKNNSTYVGSLTTIRNVELLGISQPLYDDDGEIQIIMTYSQEKNTLKAFSSVLEQEKIKSEKYKSVIHYYSKLGNQNKIIAHDKEFRKILSFIDRLSSIDGTILLTGESGVGKDVIANYIHFNSNRAGESFIPVNCAAIPSNLMESEFFGYTKGAFTGANAQGKPGFFEMAHNGTLFLDEIGDLPLDMQSKLLRVLETGEIIRLGDAKYTKVNVRLIAATNKDLKKLIVENAFREDLYYRLMIIPIHLPPLRERRDDIIPLSLFFLDEYNKKYSCQKIFSQDLLEVFLKYEWKGNIRELNNLIHRLILSCENDIIQPSDLNAFGAIMPVKQESIPLDASVTSAPQTLNEKFNSIEKSLVLDTLLKFKGNKSKTAEALGISRNKLYKMLNSK